MTRKNFAFSVATAFAIGIIAGCNNDPVAPPAQQGESPTVPSGVTVIYSDGFASIDTTKWAKNYMINMGDFYSHMRITTDAFHTGTHSVTSDSNRKALLYTLSDSLSIRTGIAGVQFYMMAKALGQANFTVEIGKNAGSSGGLGYAFGIGFDPNDSIKCKYFDMLGNQTVVDAMIAPIQLNHWYKCVVEVNFTAKTVTYSIDDATITKPMPAAADMSKIDRMLVFRGASVGRSDGFTNVDCVDGPKQYYADDIVLYNK